MAARPRAPKGPGFKKGEAFKMPEEIWESDVKTQLCSNGEKPLIVRYASEMAPGLKAEALQLAKFFTEEMEGEDPFYIEGNDWNQVVKDTDQGNYVNNFVDIGNIDDFEDIQLLDILPGKSSVEILFHHFHEISVKKRLDIIYFLC